VGVFSEHSVEDANCEIPSSVVQYQSYIMILQSNSQLINEALMNVSN